MWRLFRFLAAKAGPDGRFATGELVRIAQGTTNDPQVKDLASKVLSGDVMIQSRIRQIAQKNGVSLPSKLDTPDVHLKQMLQKDSKDVNAFNEAYTQAMLDKFHAANNFFTIEAQQTKNPELRSFAQATLPKIEKTMDQVETVASNLPPVTTAMVK